MVRIAGLSLLPFAEHPQCTVRRCLSYSCQGICRHTPDHGAQFNNLLLLQQAFVHRSYLNENPESAAGSNERLDDNRRLRKRQSSGFSTGAVARKLPYGVESPAVRKRTGSSIIRGGP